MCIIKKILFYIKVSLLDMFYFIKKRVISNLHFIFLLYLQMVILFNVELLIVRISTFYFLATLKVFYFVMPIWAYYFMSTILWAYYINVMGNFSDTYLNANVLPYIVITRNNFFIYWNVRVKWLTRIFFGICGLNNEVW